jgi:nucleotide-binding universal stress UspA family protein
LPKQSFDPAESWWTQGVLGHTLQSIIHARTIMPYKTLLVHADLSPHAAQRLRVAAELARGFEAHLVGAAMTGVSRFLYQDSSIDLTRTVLAVQMDALRSQADRALDDFDAAANSAGVASFERCLADDDPNGALAQHARYADLVVVSQADPDDAYARLFPDLPEYVMLNGGRPVLVLPYAGRFESLGSHALLAWDGSIEATHATSHALPLLKRMRKVTVAVFNPGMDHGAQPGSDIALYLARHGIAVEVTVQPTALDVGNALLSMASDIGADLLVMGGYGHTRFRELLLGGVTATILRTMTIPVLMSH